MLKFLCFKSYKITYTNKFFFILPLIICYLLHYYKSLNDLDKFLLFNSENNSAWRSYINLYKNETLTIKDCNEKINGSCDCFFKQINNDLSFWKNSKNVNSQTLKNSKNLGVHYQIINNKLYRQKSCQFISRCQGVEYFLLKVLKKTKINDIDLLINVHDWPRLHYQKNNFFPVFSFSKDVDVYKDILYPAWSFKTGGPAINSHPTGIGEWDSMKKKISKFSKKNYSSKKDIAFFRGSRTNQERDTIILISKKSDLVDAKYTKNQAWRSIKDSLNEEPVEEVSFEKHCDYKYLINLRGVAASFRYRHLFMCKSVVLNVKSRWVEFFYDILKPWYHYIPLEREGKNIDDIVKFLKKYPSIGETISENGFNLINNYLNEKNVLCYWEKLLKEYQALIKYKVKSEKDFLLIN